MKLIRKEFEIENVVIVNGEPVVNRQKRVVYFSMDLMSHKLIEQRLGKPLINLFSGKSQEELMASLLTAETMLTLASACYLKTDDGFVKHNEQTMEEFINSDLAQVATSQELLMDIASAIADYFGNGEKNADSMAKPSKKK